MKKNKGKANPLGTVDSVQGVPVEAAESCEFRRTVSQDISAEGECVTVITLLPL